MKKGEVEVLSRGRYALPTARAAWRTAHELTAVLCLRSAAAHYEWGMKQQPEKPELAVRRGRKIAKDKRAQVRVVWMEVGLDDHAAGITSPLRTVVDCARLLPFDEALAIADSALRSGLVTRDELDTVSVRGAGAGAVRRVVEAADGRAANAFESVLRALCIEVGVLVVPQQPVLLGIDVIHPDLVAAALGVVIEADSWTFHATRKAHKRDCARYTLLVVHGWRVVRFTWEQVMHDQAYVRWVLTQLRRVERPEALQRVVRSA